MQEQLMKDFEKYNHNKKVFYYSHNVQCWV